MWPDCGIKSYLISVQKLLNLVTLEATSTVKILGNVDEISSLYSALKLWSSLANIKYRYGELHLN